MYSRRGNSGFNPVRRPALKKRPAKREEKKPVANLSTLREKMEKRLSRQ
jgi:hypothetical protein